MARPHQAQTCQTNAPSAHRGGRAAPDGSAQHRAQVDSHDPPGMHYQRRNREVVNPGEWRDSRVSPAQSFVSWACTLTRWDFGRQVTWRNREAELHDPDFSRNYNAYRPNSNFGGYGMNR